MQQDACEHTSRSEVEQPLHEEKNAEFLNWGHSATNRSSHHAVPLHAQGEAKPMAARIPRSTRAVKGKRNEEGMLAILCEWVVEHQIGMCE
jgi:hypothetical protein